MLLCNVYAMLFVDSVDIYSENYWGGSLCHCMQDAACFDILWILQNLLFQHTSSWQEKFLNISNHLLNSWPKI